MSKTQELASTLTDLSVIFNKELFDNALPDCLIFVADLNERRRGDLRCGGQVVLQSCRYTGEEMTTAYINLDTSHAGEAVALGRYENLLATLVHEMSHLSCYINHKSKSHCKIWRKQMAALGLPPYKKGARWENEACSHTIDPNGRFMRTYEQIPQDLLNSIPQFGRTVAKKATPKVSHTSTVKCNLCGVPYRFTRKDDEAFNCFGTNQQNAHDMNVIFRTGVQELCR